VYPRCLSVKIILKSRTAKKRKKKTIVSHPYRCCKKNKNKKSEALPAISSASVTRTATLTVLDTLDRKQIYFK
jgi:hypothetical protein